MTVAPGHYTVSNSAKPVITNGRSLLLVPHQTQPVTRDKRRRVEECSGVTDRTRVGS
jgi:hypothetical protein